MEENAKIMPANKFKMTECTDKPGECFQGANEHYFRQDDHQVLHVADRIVNTLPVNHLEEGRENWGDKFDKIDPLIFQAQLEKQMYKFFE